MPRPTKKRKFSTVKKESGPGSVYGRSVAKIPALLKYRAPIAPSHRCSLKYYDSTVLTGTGSDEQWFRANSLFDPDYTLAGHQPGGFDELATLYNSYRVDRCTIRATVQANGTNSRPMVLSVIIKDNPTALATTANAFEQPGASPFVVQNYTGATEYLSYSYDLHTVSGQTKSQWRNNDANAALVTASPADTVWLVLHAAYADGTASGFDAYVTFTLTFDCEFYDAKLTSSS